MLVINNHFKLIVICKMLHSPSRWSQPSWMRFFSLQIKSAISRDIISPLIAATSLPPWEKITRAQIKRSWGPWDVPKTKKVSFLKLNASSENMWYSSASYYWNVIKFQGNCWSLATLQPLQAKFYPSKKLRVLVGHPVYFFASIHLQNLSFYKLFWF